MIQVQSLVKIVDNSGSKLGQCIKIIKGYRHRWTSVLTPILISIKKLKKVKKVKPKVQKGQIHLGIIIRSKFPFKRKLTSFVKFQENAVALVNKTNYRPIGTRLNGPVLRELRFTKFMKIASLSEGFI